MSSWFPSWDNVLARLEPFGILMEWWYRDGDDFGCYLVGVRDGKRITYPIDLSPNHDRATVTVPPSIRAIICRRFKLDPSVLDVEL